MLRVPAISRAIAVASLALAGSIAGPATAAQGDPFQDQQWGYNVIGADRAHGVATGAGTVIAIIDSGVDLVHQDLASKIVPGWDFVDDDDNPQDEQGHGTHVAGIAAAATGNGVGIAGVAPGAKIMPIRVLNADGEGNTQDVLDGIYWAVDHGADVVNLSLARQLQGVLGSGLSNAITYAWDHGVILVLAAGNDQFMGSGFSNESAMVVSSTDHNDGQPDYSNGVSNAKWGMAAPGGDCPVTCTGETAIVSTWWNPGQPDAYAYISGTSMAAPHVAGAAAVLLSSGLTPQQTVDRLLSTAVDLGAKGRDNIYGAGRLDLAAAVGAGSAPAPAPAPSPTPKPSTPAPTPKPSTPAPSTPAPAPSTPAPGSTTPAPGSSSPAPSAPDASSSTPDSTTSPAPTASPAAVASSPPSPPGDTSQVVAPSAPPVAAPDPAPTDERGILPWVALALLTATTAALTAARRDGRQHT